MSALSLLVLRAITGISCVLALLKVWNSRSQLRRTTLLSARGWTMAALLATGLAAGFESVLANHLHQAREIKQQFWYWSTVLLSCPLISVLGCRRPTERVWNLFIILPLFFVLGWPALTVLVEFPRLHLLQVQTPVVWGFAVVLVMGVGNYLSTRYAWGSLLAGLAVVAGLLPLTTFCPDWWPGHAWCLPTFLASLAVLEVSRQAARPVLAATPEDRIWLDFQETFGLVWSARMMERINLTAGQEAWGVTLYPDGFRPADADAGSVSKGAREKMLHALRWHLRRFVDPEWIDERLAQGSEAEGQADETGTTSR